LRQLFIICTVFIPLLGHFSAKANTAISKIEIRETSSATIIYCIQHDNSGDIIQSNYFDHNTLKVRYQRILPAFITADNVPALIPVSATKHSDKYASLPYFSLTKLLLFPHHYFW
jgi:hypothetical protein